MVRVAFLKCFTAKAAFSVRMAGCGLERRIFQYLHKANPDGVLIWDTKRLVEKCGFAPPNKNEPMPPTAH
jgi:hypothetical protein